MKKNKKVGIYVFFLLLHITVIAATTQKVILDIPSGVVINGKNITVTGIQGNGVNVDVDGVVEYVQDNETKLINGAVLYVYGLSRSPPRVIIDINVTIVCGDGTCGTGEDTVICCTDCGCLTSSLLCQKNRCIENITRPEAKNDCFVDADCTDSDACTTAVCDVSAYPNKCVFSQLTACVANDGCCPKNCDVPEDTDCAVVDKCSSDQDCKDQNACTGEICTGMPKRCVITAQQGCSNEDVCMPEGTIDQGRYCLAASGEWKDQKKDGSVCAEDYECVALSCIFKKCGEGNKNLFPKLFIGIIILILLAGGYYIFVAVRKETGD